MKANKTYQVQQHGLKTEYKTKKAALNLANELAMYSESDNVSVYEYNHNTGIYTEIYTREYNNEANTVDFSELSLTGQCTNIYLHNTAEIYERYTVEAVRYAAGLAAFGWDYVTETLINGAKVNGVEVVNEAVKAAVLLVKKYDHLTPTAKDIEQVTRNYAAYIVESAKYEVENA